MPADVGNGLPHEIFIGGILPDAIDSGFIQASVEQFIEGGLLLVAYSFAAIKGVFQAEAQHTACAQIELPQQRSPPGIPEIWVGCTDVCHGERIQVIQVQLVESETEQEDPAPVVEKPR